MRVVKYLLSVMIFGSIVFFSLSCTAGANATATPKPQIYTVQKGNISITVTGTGNLAYSHSEDLAFEMAGYAASVSVSAGDTVEEGQEIATLDTSDWNKQIRKLEEALTTAQRNLNNKTNALASTQRQVASKELAVQQAQLDLDTAEYNLSQITEVKDAQDKVDAAQNSLDIAEANLQVALKQGADTDGPRQQIAFFTNELEKAKVLLNRILDGNDVTIKTTVAMDIAQDQLKVQQAQKSLEDAQAAVEDARTAVKNAQLDVDEANQSVQDAQSDLDEEKSLNPVIKAPFAGYITKVNVSGGDEIQKGTIAAQIADPDQFEANILVTENDISSVKLGEAATVSCDAYSGLNFPAKISQIAPLATVSQGVVNYKVTVELTSLQPVFPTRGGQGLSQRTAGGATPASPGNIPGGSPPAGGFSGTPGGGPPSGNFILPTITLKDGLSATVTVPIQEKDNIIIIPSRAITRQGQNATVQVVKGSTTETETRNIKTGLSDASNIEVTEGLSEGEQVLVKAASTSSTSGFGGPPPGGFMIR